MNKNIDIYKKYIKIVESPMVSTRLNTELGTIANSALKRGYIIKLGRIKTSISSAESRKDLPTLTIVKENVGYVKLILYLNFHFDLFVYDQQSGGYKKQRSYSDHEQVFDALDKCQPKDPTRLITRDNLPEPNNFFFDDNIVMASDDIITGYRKARIVYASLHSIVSINEKARITEEITNPSASPWFLFSIYLTSGNTVKILYKDNTYHTTKNNRIITDNLRLTFLDMQLLNRIVEVYTNKIGACV